MFTPGSSVGLLDNWLDRVGGFWAPVSTEAVDPDTLDDDCDALDQYAAVKAYLDDAKAIADDRRTG